MWKQHHRQSLLKIKLIKLMSQMDLTKNISGSGADLQVGQVVGPRWADVENGDLLPLLLGLEHDPVARKNVQR